MKLKFKRQRVQEEIPQASMSDIAFLLLIFFISTTIFSVEQGIPVILPGRASTVKKVSRKNVLVINTDSRGVVYLDGNPVRVRDIRDIVKRRIEANDKLIVSIESHPDASYQSMVDILDEVKLAKATRFALKMRKL